MLLLVWILSITALDPSANKIIPSNKPLFAAQSDCEAAREAFIRANMYKNWQGLTMAPLVRTLCQQYDPTGE